jgi:PilZ domain-containing protein
MQPRCSVAGCDKAAACSLGTRAFCRPHFLSTCYQELEQCSEQIKWRPLTDAAAESLAEFLAQCTSQTTLLALHASDLSNLERAQLLDLLLWGAELSRCLRRSARVPRAVAVRLRCEEPGRVWDEETKTLVLSRHGASIECSHPIESGDTLLVERIDSGRRANARVVWHQPKEGGRVKIAIEFSDCDDFWDIEWSAAGRVP